LDALMDRMAAVLRGLAVLLALFWAMPASAVIAPDTIRDLAFGEGDARGKAIATLVASGDPGALSLLQALLAGDIKTVGDDKVLLVKGDEATELLTGKAVKPVPEEAEDLSVNNRMRRELGTAIAALKLSAADRTTRLAAVKELQNGADEDTLPAISAALAKEAEAELIGLPALTQVSVQLASGDKATRLAAVKALALSDSGTVKTLLLAVLEKKGGQFVEAGLGLGSFGFKPAENAFEAVVDLRIDGIEHPLEARDFGM